MRPKGGIGTSDRPGAGEISPPSCPCTPLALCAHFAAGTLQGAPRHVLSHTAVTDKVSVSGNGATGGDSAAINMMNLDELAGIIKYVLLPSTHPNTVGLEELANFAATCIDVMELACVSVT